MLAHDVIILINIAPKYAIIAFGYVIITSICCTKCSIVYVTKIVAQKAFYGCLRFVYITDVYILMSCIGASTQLAKKFLASQEFFG